MDSDDKKSFFDDSSLGRNSDHFEKIQKLARMGSWSYNLITKKFDGSGEALRIYGLEGKEFLFEHVRNIALPEYHEQLQSEMDNLINKNGIYDLAFRIRRSSDGEIRDIHSIAEYDPAEKQITGIIQDITERKKMEKALYSSEKRYRSLFDNSVSGIIFVDLQGRILEVNRKMLELLGSPSVEDTKKINMLTFPLLVKVGFSGDLQNVIDTGESLAGSTNYVSKWGKTLYLEYVLTPIKNDHSMLGIMGKIEDVTERKQAEVQIEALLKEKDIILREVHHRIKNNMASMESLLSLQVMNSANSAVKAELKDVIGRMGSMRVLYEKLYQSEDFLKTTSGAYLSKLIDEIAGVFPESDEVIIKKEIDDFVIPAKVTFSLGIIVNELLTNCIKYAFTSPKRENIINIRAGRNGSLVNITVKDNGKGFSSEDLVHSTGFGLQLIKMLSEQIGGKAEMYNDKGAVISISFDV